MLCHGYGLGFSRILTPDHISDAWVSNERDALYGICVLQPNLKLILQKYPGTRLIGRRKLPVNPSVSRAGPIWPRGSFASSALDSPFEADRQDRSVYLYTPPVPPSVPLDLLAVQQPDVTVWFTVRVTSAYLLFDDFVSCSKGPLSQLILHLPLLWFRETIDKCSPHCFFR
jgi:hypothetical protein